MSRDFYLLPTEEREMGVEVGTLVGVSLEGAHSVSTEGKFASDAFLFDTGRTTGPSGRQTGRVLWAVATAQCGPIFCCPKDFVPSGGQCCYVLYSAPLRSEPLTTPETLCQMKNAYPSFPTEST